MKKSKKDFYLTLKEASASAQRLGFRSQKEYLSGRYVDPRLPSSPHLFYKKNWSCWSSFLGKTVDNLYSHLAEASASAQYLKIGSQKEYLLKRHHDARLPSDPAKKFKVDWQSWFIFLGADVRLYSTLAEASKAAQKLGFSNIKEYQLGRIKDPRLPYKPDRSYKDEWQGWSFFLGKVTNRFYATLAEASAAAKKLRFDTIRDYKLGRHQNSRLPCSPNKMFKSEWQNWPHFLGKKAARFYSTLAEVSAVAQGFQFRSAKEYKLGRHKNSLLPSCPNEVFKDEWESWPHFLGKETCYTLPEASAAAQKLGLRSKQEYRLRRNEDSRLPSNPTQMFKGEWKSWVIFLGENAFRLYPTLAEASIAAQFFEFSSSKEYKAGCYQDWLLPLHPHTFYKGEWQGWPHFLGKLTFNFIPRLLKPKQRQRF